jgi:hypothetical protein
MNVLASLIKQGQRKFAVVALAGGVAASGTMVYSASNAAFNATTSNPTNAWSTGQVVLTDDDSSGAMFTLTGADAVTPGESGVKCIRVDYDGSMPAPVMIYAASITDDATTGAQAGHTIGEYINLKVEQGTQAASSSPDFTHDADCADNAKFTIDDAADGIVWNGSLANFKTHTNYAGGLSAGNAQAWAPDDTTDYKIYRFTWNTTAMPDSLGVQNKNFVCTVTWQARGQ